MKQNNLLLNISDQQLQQAGLTRAQARKSLAALDYRDNDVFRHVMNAENPVSRKILTMYLSDLLHRRIVWIGSEATEPVKANFREKGVRYDVMVRIRDDQGKPMGEFRNAELSDGGIVIAAVAGLCLKDGFRSD